MITPETTGHRFTDDQYIQISALQHYSYCKRQCALIHIEDVWTDNVYTLRGTRYHERVDSSETTIDSDVRSFRSVPLWSDELGLVGRADAVEIHPDGTAVPIEYKLGKRRQSLHDDVQLCAQALCLESMLATHIPWGYVYSISSNRRRKVSLDTELRNITTTLIQQVRTLLLDTGPLPPPVDDGRCPDCSLWDACMPKVVSKAQQKYLEHSLFVISEDDG